MPNDPKDQVIDWSKITNTSNSNNQTQGTLITSLNEGMNLIGVETSSNNILLGRETFTKNKAKNR
jgi:hypothetical protein